MLITVVPNSIDIPRSKKPFIGFKVLLVKPGRWGRVTFELRTFMVPPGMTTNEETLAQKLEAANEYATELGVLLDARVETHQ